MHNTSSPQDHTTDEAAPRKQLAKDARRLVHRRHYSPFTVVSTRAFEGEWENDKEDEEDKSLVLHGFCVTSNLFIWNVEGKDHEEEVEEETGVEECSPETNENDDDTDDRETKLSATIGQGSQI